MDPGCVSSQRFTTGASRQAWPTLASEFLHCPVGFWSRWAGRLLDPHSSCRVLWGLQALISLLWGGGSPLGLVPPVKLSVPAQGVHVVPLVLCLLGWALPLGP